MEAFTPRVELHHCLIRSGLLNGSSPKTAVPDRRTYLVRPGKTQSIGNG